MASTTSKSQPRSASASHDRLDMTHGVNRAVASLRKWLRMNPRKPSGPRPALRRVPMEDRDRVAAVAGRISRYARCKDNPHVDHEDLVQEGILANLEAARHRGEDLSPDRCVKRANLRMNGVVREARRQLPGRLDADLIPGDDDLTPLDRAAEEDALVYDRGLLDMRAALDVLMRRLTRRQRVVMTLRYGLDRRPPLVREDIGHAMGLSPTCVSKIEHKAIAAMRRMADEAPACAAAAE